MELNIVSKKYGTHTVYYDDEDHELVGRYKWCLRKFRTRNYAIANVVDYSGKRKQISMHRLLMSFPNEMEVDHVDLNGLNNTRRNLRLATHAENNKNKKCQSNNKTGFKGVHLYKRYNTYQAYIWIDRKRIHLGYFKTAIEAAKRYNEEAVRLHGEFANLNFIPNES